MLVETIYLIKCVYVFFINTIFIHIPKQNKLVSGHSLIITKEEIIPHKKSNILISNALIT